MRNAKQVIYGITVLIYLVNRLTREPLSFDIREGIIVAICQATGNILFQFLVLPLFS